MEKQFRAIVKLTFLVVALMMSLSVSAAAARRIDPVIVSGAQLENLLGQAPESIAAFAYSAGTLQPIPSQVDERMEVSAYQTWTTRTMVFSYAFDSGPKAQPDPDPGFDRDDELVFMAATAGAKAPESVVPPGALKCEEVELENPESKERSYVYVCAMSGPAPAVTERLITLNGPDEIQAAGYLIGFPENNPVNFDRLQARGPGGLMKDVVDRFKVQFKIVIAFGIATYPLTDQDQVHYLRGIKAGPVRVIKEYETVLETFPNCQVRTYNHVYFYPYHIEYDVLIRGPGNWGKDIHASHLILGIDLNDEGRGMTFLSEKNMAGEKIDGYTSATELDMDYGPTEWAGVTGQGAGTIMVHLGLDRFTELYKDLYYSDNDDKGDPPEEIPGMIGKFGFMVRNLQKEGFNPFPMRFSVYPRPEDYRPGLETDLTELYQAPLIVRIGRHQLRAVAKDAPLVEDDREKRPESIYAQQRRSSIQLTKFLAPAFIIDPNLLGSGPGVSYSDVDFLRTGTYFGCMAMWTDRGYASYDITFSELRFIEGVEAFKISAHYGSFPAEPFYGTGNDSDVDEVTLYWWKKTEVEVNFKKFFADIYGAEFRFKYRDIEIDSGIKPRTGEGTDSIEEHYGLDDEIVEGRYGPPVYGRQGGNISSMEVLLYRDMRNDKNLPKYGNFQQLNLQLVSSVFGADYDYARVSLDLRGYYHPDFLNPVIGLDDNVNPRRTFLTKFFGMDKNRTIAGRVTFTHLIADEIEWHGDEILDVPFYELTTLGSSQTHRAFRSKRFRDNDMVTASLEYRWRWWRFHDMVIWYDTGMVMDDLFEEKSWENDWHNGVGYGWRLNVPPNIVITFEFGYSIEENGMMYQANAAF